MKKHNFNEAIEIFKEMFEGWSVVTKAGEKHQLTGCDINEKHQQKVCYFNHEMWMESEISHLEQTKPMNGDEVWAWDDLINIRRARFYVGKTPSGKNICCTKHGAIDVYNNVELISPTRKITLQEATEMLKGIVAEPFEITKE